MIGQRHTQPKPTDWPWQFAAALVCLAACCTSAFAQQQPQAQQQQQPQQQQLQQQQQQPSPQPKSPYHGNTIRLVQLPNQPTPSSGQPTQYDWATKVFRTFAPQAESEPLPPPQTEFQVPLPKPEHVELKKDGDRISLFVRGAPLKSVLSMLAESVGLNIVCADNITTNVSVSLYQVTWQEALDAVVSVAGYTWTTHEGIIHVTSIQNAQNLAPEIQGRQVELFELDFASASDVNSVITGMLSPAGHTQTMLRSSSDNTKTREMVVVEDLPAYLERIRNYVLQMDQPPRQVLIEAHVLQIDLKDDFRHGVDFEHLFNIGAVPVKLSMAGMADPDASSAFFAELSGPRLSGLLEMLKTTTDAKTLASPKVMVINGQQARIQIGKQLGFRGTTTITETAATDSVQFLDVGVVLEVTPRISRADEVLLRVKPKISSGNINPDTELPEEETTEVETDVLLHDGRGIIIGGLIQEKDVIVQHKFPGLGDIRHVGKLFQKREVEKVRTEIVIALVPRVLQCGAPQCEVLQSELSRCQTPLFQGPLDRVQRPWEPILPDAVRNPITFRRLPPVGFVGPRGNDLNRGFENFSEEIRVGRTTPAGTIRR